MKKLKIPVGISDFAKLRTYGYYYVDKTRLIEDLLDDPAEVTLITRPRRFGKSLGMSMLEHFFDVRKDSRDLFAGLEILENPAVCDEWMNHWPTLSISFKRVAGLDFVSAYGMLCSVIKELCLEHSYLQESEAVNIDDKKIIQNVRQGTATRTEIKNSLLTISRAMREHYGKPVILLLDEYDVPLAKASSNGYYAEMLDVMKGIMQAMKDNQNLRLAIITGCLRISKESIFTGTNNFVSNSISSPHLNEYFGFTQADVDQILQDSERTDQAEAIKTWYDGYHFGDLDVYCPWDVMNYLWDLQKNPKAKPASYWKNTSDNAVIRSFLDYAGESISKKLEVLLSGGYIQQPVSDDLTYDYLHSSENNLWSVLYLTGYLTSVREEDLSGPLPEGLSALTIPNAEVREIFSSTIKTWFDESALSWNRKALFEAAWSGDAETLTEEMSKLLRKTISYHDYKEDFYHAFLAGIFAGAGYIVESNREHGEGRSDVLVQNPSNSRMVLFEAKYAKTLDGMGAACDAALQQIEDRQYVKDFMEDYDSIRCYGIAFYKKRCLIRAKA